MKSFSVNRVWVPFKLIAIILTSGQIFARSQLSIMGGLKCKMDDKVLSLSSRKMRKMQFSFGHKTCSPDKDIERIHEEMKEHIY